MKENRSEETYKIYNYMEGHHSLLIASVSAIVAVGSLATCILIYISHCIRLSEWNIPIEIIGEVKHGRYFYVAIIGVLYYYSVPMCQKNLYNIFQKYYFYFPIIKLEKQLLRKIYNKNADKETRNIMKNRIKPIKKDINSYKKELIGVIFLSIIAIGILCGSLAILFLISMGSFNRYCWIIVAILLLTMLLITFFSFRKIGRRKDIDNIKKRVREVSNIDEVFDLLTEIQNIKISLKQSRERKEFIEHLRDDNIVESAEIIFISFVMLCIVLIVNTYTTIKNQTGFWLYQDDTGQRYAVVYQDEEQVVLEEVFIDNDNISINVDKQLFLCYKDNLFEYYEFESVEKVNNNIFTK